MAASKKRTQSRGEEIANSVSHGVGLLAVVVAAPVLIAGAVQQGGVTRLIGASVFVSTVGLVYVTSVLYHALPPNRAKRIFQVLDHGAIFLLIAGTYTPFTLIILEGPLGWAMFGLAWGLALTGITLKLFFTGRFERLSTSMYVFMGWMMVFAIKPLLANFAPEGMAWLIAGGICYTVGALLYSIKKLPFGHAAFHILVLLGSACHFVAVYFFVLAPSNS